MARIFPMKCREKIIFWVAIFLPQLANSSMLLSASITWCWRLPFSYSSTKLSLFNMRKLINSAVLPLTFVCISNYRWPFQPMALSDKKYWHMPGTVAVQAKMLLTFSGRPLHVLTRRAAAHRMTWNWLVEGADTECVNAIWGREVNICREWRGNPRSCHQLFTCIIVLFRICARCCCFEYIKSLLCTGPCISLSRTLLLSYLTHSLSHSVCFILDWPTIIVGLA